MYNEFFGLKENPFNVNPDPRYLFLKRQTEEALACLKYGIEARKGFILLTGEVGTGKTTLLKALFDWLRQQRAATAFVFNPQLSVPQFFDFVMSDFGIACDSPMKSQLLLRLNQWLLERHRVGEPAVLVIDEAQNLSSQMLEEIRLLTNLETSTEKLLQIVLAGQPELEQKLKQPQLRQLLQRITLRAKTLPLTRQETRGYILERLRIAGADGQEIFSPDAIDAVHNYARGIPRVTNVLCEHALIAAFADHRKPVPRETVEEAARDFGLQEAESLPQTKMAASPAMQSKPVPAPRETVEEAARDFGLQEAELLPQTKIAASPATQSKPAPRETAEEAARDFELQEAESLPQTEMAASPAARSWKRPSEPLRPDAAPSNIKKMLLIPTAAAVLIGVGIGAGMLLRGSHAGTPQTVAAANNPSPAPVPPPESASQPQLTKNPVSAKPAAITNITLARTAPAPAVEPLPVSGNEAPRANSPAPAAVQPSAPNVNVGKISVPVAKNSPRATVSDVPVVPVPGAQASLAGGNLNAGLLGGAVGNDALPPPALPSGGKVQPPRLISSVSAVYPLAARTAHIEGDVVVEAVVDPTGKVTSVNAISGPLLLQQPALDAVRSWKYQPAQLDGKPIEVHTQVSLSFHIQ